jgi:hypothetical protein
VTANLNALAATRLSPPESQAFLARQPVNKLLVHEPPFTPQEHPESSMPIVHPACSQVSKSNADFAPRMTPGPGAEARLGKSQHPAGPTLGNPTDDLHVLYQNTLDRGPQRFCEITSCSIFLSGLRSAIDCLGFRFPSSEGPKATQFSAMPNPANRFFHL